MISFAVILNRFPEEWCDRIFYSFDLKFVLQQIYTTQLGNNQAPGIRTIKCIEVNDRDICKHIGIWKFPEEADDFINQFAAESFFHRLSSKY